MEILLPLWRQQLVVARHAQQQRAANPPLVPINFHVSSKCDSSDRFACRVASDDASSDIENIVTTTGLLFRQLAQHSADHIRRRLPTIYSRKLGDVIFEQPYCRISNLSEADIAGRQTASRLLKSLESSGALSSQAVGKEWLSLLPKLMAQLIRDHNAFEAN